MNIDPRILAMKDEVIAWRRDFHSHPEILYEVHRTAKIVEDKLKSFGCDEVVTGIGRTGVVGIIHGRNGPGKHAVGLRADMDALPVSEETNLAYASKTAGKMHACGHDGHTAMLLGAARHLAEARDFDGTIAVIFQPAEEGGKGALAMVDDGMMERWGITEVYGMHNMPGIAAGEFAMRKGPIMAAADRFTIEIEGLGSHAAQPHQGVDTILIGAHIVTALQSISARNIDPLKSVVVSTTIFDAGTAFNILPQRTILSGTVRTLETAVRERTYERMNAIVSQCAKMFGAEAKLTVEHGCSPTMNHPTQTEHTVRVAREIVGTAAVNPEVEPCMAGEDFAYMLESRPGAYIFIGNGDSAGLHHPAYDFNDTIIPAGVQFWANLGRARAGI